MSITTWVQEFYSVDARQVAVPDSITHSLLKWTGLRAENLNKHGVYPSEHSNRRLIDDDCESYGFFLSSENCALCVHFYDDEPEGYSHACKDCPLSKARGGVACTSPLIAKDKSPWNAWTDDLNPEPMIFWLKEAERKGV